MWFDPIYLTVTWPCGRTTHQLWSYFDPNVPKPNWFTKKHLKSSLSQWANPLQTREESDTKKRRQRQTFLVIQLKLFQRQLFVHVGHHWSYIEAVCGKLLIMNQKNNTCICTAVSTCNHTHQQHTVPVTSGLVSVFSLVVFIVLDHEMGMLKIGCQELWECYVMKCQRSGTA